MNIFSLAKFKRLLAALVLIALVMAAPFPMLALNLKPDAYAKKKYTDVFCFTGRLS